MEKWRFTIEETPDLGPGYYPTLLSWDAAEGTIPGAHYWNGTHFEGGWRAGPVVAWLPIPCADADTAIAIALDNDPDDPTL